MRVTTKVTITKIRVSIQSPKPLIPVNNDLTASTP